MSTKIFIMKKTLLNNPIVGIFFVGLFLMTLSCKPWAFPILLGILGICMVILALFDFKKRWKKNTLVAITGVLFFFGSGQLLCENFNVSEQVITGFRIGLIATLVADVTALCIIAVITAIKD